ncbi:G-protein coupled receptor 143-like [Ischnura elegans]|uniref:G-protein coupled receptor 143-like n=1 Tax=Ischnura elegans TaxID=197161 RepID=UPI001ED8A109|nr:G-protein coupled receptor 143-like [Ischnura elegans]
MADPTIQTFCCHLPNKDDPSYKILFEFNSETYNYVVLVSSFIGILGAIYQILPREEIYPTHRWVYFPTTRGRQIIVCLALADLMASAGVFVRSMLWINYKDLQPSADNTASTLFCALTSAWTQYFYGVTWCWTFCYAVDVRRVLQGKECRFAVYHTIAWLVPAFLTTTGLSILYIPDAKCHGLGSKTFGRILPNYFATFLPILIVMIVNPILYHSATNQARDAVSLGLSQYTRRERNVVDAVRLKFLAINVAFYVCWLPNIVNGFLLWTLWFDLPRTVVLVLWYIMAFTNPLQALFNSIVYRKWGKFSRERIYLPCRSQVESHATSSDSPSGAALAAYFRTPGSSTNPQLQANVKDNTEDEDRELGADSERTPLLMRRRGTGEACGPVSINNGSESNPRLISESQ